MAVKKGLACGSYVTVMLPPFPCDPFHPSRPLEPSRPLFPLGVPCLRSLLGPRGRPFPPTLTSLRPPSQSANPLGIHQVQLLLACCEYTHLEKGMACSPEGHVDLH